MGPLFRGRIAALVCVLTVTGLLPLHAAGDAELPPVEPSAAPAWLYSVGDTGYLEWSLVRFEEEFLALAPGKPLDPRFVTCLMIRPAEPSSLPHAS